MRMILASLITCIAMFTESGPAQAAVLRDIEATYRYSFDVKSTGLYFNDNFSYTNGVSTAKIIETLHPLAHIQGQQFSVAFTIRVLLDQYDSARPFDGMNYGVAEYASCLSGPLCISGTKNFKLGSYNHGYFDTDYNSKGITAWFGDYLIKLGFSDDRTGTLYLVADVSDTFYGEIDGRPAYIAGPEASFSIENVQASISVPLPASALLLGAGLIPLALLRRRRRA